MALPCRRTASLICRRSVDVLLRMVDAADVRASDVFVDVGAGPGRAVAFVHLLTGAAAVGIEIQPALVRAARDLTSRLHLSRVSLVEGDAATLAGRMTTGSVFFFTVRSAAPAWRRCSTTWNRSREQGRFASAASISRSRRVDGSPANRAGAKTSSSTRDLREVTEPSSPSRTPSRSRSIPDPAAVAGRDRREGQVARRRRGRADRRRPPARLGARSGMKRAVAGS